MIPFQPYSIVAMMFLLKIEFLIFMTRWETYVMALLRLSQKCNESIQISSPMIVEK